jgi:hydroxymethylpyrimidine pyrophosphatase-like HAD family hydrolase
MTTMKELNKVADALPDSLYIEMSENTVGMIMNKDAKKDRAIKRLAEHFGCSLSDVVAFGDDYNDISMLSVCGVGVAVANALDEAKAAADYVCDSNDNEGVAKWLEENVL